jgi:hypothetical protein
VRCAYDAVDQLVERAHVARMARYGINITRLRVQALLGQRVRPPLILVVGDAEHLHTARVMTHSVKPRGFLS